jgi:hypothetical protein
MKKWGFQQFLMKKKRGLAHIFQFENQYVTGGR